MEFWKRKSEDYTERCDFQGLPRSSQATKEKAIPYGYRNTVLNGSTFKYLSSISNNSSPLRLQALINLAWHKTLNVFGNGSHTITVTCLKVDQDQGFKLIPVISDHPKYSDQTIEEILKDIETDMENCLISKFTLEPESEIPEHFCDSVILWGDESFSKQWNVPLTLQIEERGSAAFDIGVSYNSYLFEGVIIDGVMDFFLTVVGELVKDAHQASTLSSIEFLPPDQKKQIEQWNDVTTGSYPEDKRLHHLVEEAAQSTPNNVAVICEDTQVTYEELNGRANQVAHFLHSREGVKVEQFIALFLDKTEVLLMTILGIWKSGAAHIPIDPQYPDERVRFTLEDTGAKILITNRKYRERLEGIFSEDQFQVKIISVEELLKMAEVESKENLDLPLKSEQLAYVTYTSGTTGVPKGVYKEHKGVVNSITDLSIRYEMRKRPEVVALFSAYVWEPFIRQTFIALANSQLLVIADDTDKLDQLKFLHFLNKHGVTYLNGTGSVLQEYELEKCPTLTKLILVGEELTKRRYDSLREKFHGRLICEYGFTESALVTCMNSFNPGDQRVDRSIGLPLRNVKAYVLNSDLKRVPVGAIGELYIGGVGISRGYMNRDSLTKERFLANPFQTKEEKAKGINNLMYKTGDLTRWIGNGKIEYIGRNDFQIKLRGTRIEPAEIESVVLQYPSMSKCTVAVKDSKSAEESTASSRHLVGYFVAAQVIPEEEVIRYLESKLPRYMIPVRMIQVDDIRTNINGKVDLKALPEVELVRELKPEDQVYNPRNEVDSKLIKIWSDAVGIPENGIGIHDDFFRLGGHSITCIQLVARIRQQFSCDVSIDNIFSLRTIEKLSDFISIQIGANPLQTKTLSLENDMGQGENNEILANSLQQGLVYHHLKQGVDDDAYIMQTHYQYSEPVHEEFYKKAWELTQAKYPSLRLNFKVKKEVYQVFRSEESSHLDWTFLNICKASDMEAEIDNVINGDRARRYNLEMGPLFRIYLVKQSDSKYSMVFSYHHIIFDGWSIPIIFNFVHATYKRLLDGNKEATSSDESSLPDTAYILSQRYFEAHRNDHLNYWTNEVEQVDQRANLSGLLKPEVKYKVQLNNYDRITNQKKLTQKINPELLKNLQSFGATNGLTLHSILQFAWHNVLHTFGAGSHTVVGTTVFGRNIPVDGIESAVGLFINTLPLVVDHLSGKEQSVSQAIKEIQKKVNAMNSKSIVELGRLGSGNGELKHSLFDSLFVLEPDMDMGTFMGFRMVKDYEKLDYPLAVIAREEDGVLKFTLCYAGELFEDEVIQDALELLEYFLHQVASDPSQPVQHMKLVLPKQLCQLDMWNQTRKSFPEDKTLHKVFEEAAASNPSKIALVYEDSKWTYKRLNVMSNQLANYLRALVAINPDDKIALILTKNDLLILSILGVWKSGGAFVPIDPSYPEDRIQFMLEDTQAKLAIINASNAEKLGGILKKNSIKAVTIEETINNSLFDFDIKNLPRTSSSTDLCYVIYTSGTTGRPKGVMTEHRGVVNLHDSLSTIFGLKSSTEEALLSFSNFVFDHFVEQMTDALLSGQTLVILNDDMRTDKERLYKYIKDNNVTYLSGTPSVLSLYEYGELKSIGRIDAVGEDFTEASFNKIRSTFTSGIVINGYGPTETSITTHKRIYKVGERRLDKSIGHQVHNSACYILNESGQRVPIGAVGELHLGGVGVGRGYLNRDDLTKKAFVKNPFVTEEERVEGRNLRLYKTGDLARFLRNGEVECLGRNDFQVKVRGLRIELSEIEAIILSYPGITHCVVVAQNHEESTAKFLVGYYISKSPQSERSLLNFLQNKLPTFMMPNRLVEVDTIPVTINGKCDTNKLPKVSFIKGENIEDNLNLNEIETKLRFIWSELLGLPVEQIGLHDDFFSLGGDSLLVTSMTFMINKAFGKVIGVPQAFLHKTVKSLGHLISQSGRQRDEEIPKIESSFAPASLAQERLLFIDEMEGGTAAFNVPFVFKLMDNCNIKSAVEALKLVTKRHGALRTLLVKFQDSYGQKLLNDDEFDKLWEVSIHFKNVSKGDGLNKEICRAENVTFKLDQELPFRVTFIKMLKTNEYFAAVVFHHTCFDGWSLPIFQRDWIYYYNCLQAQLEGTDQEEALPKLAYHYQEFSLLQRNLLTGPALADLRLYWIEKLPNVEQLILPIDFERPSKFSYQGYEISRQLNHSTAAALKNLARAMKTSLFSVLASAFAFTLSIHSGQEDILIGSPISNRIRSEFENVIGFFINILPLRFSVNQNRTLADFIESVGTEVVTSHVNQDMPFEKLVTDLKIDKDLSRHPLVQVMLNFNPLSGPVKAIGEHDEEEDQVAPFNLLESATECQDTTAKYDLSVTVTENETGLLINFTYAKSLFSEETIQGYLDSFIHFLSIFSQPENQVMKLCELDLVGKKDRIIPLEQPIIKHTKSPPGYSTLPDVFEQVVTQSGTQTAVVFKDRHVTYNELDIRSNQVAGLLKKKVTTGNRIVALVMNKSDWMITSILGVWKSGSAYVPIDPVYPTERINFILKDTGATVILTNQINESRLEQIVRENNLQIEIIIIDAPSTLSGMSSEASSNNNLKGEDLCYIIYTSGSTGLPKGVMITHKNVLSFRKSLLQHHNKNETVLFLSNFAFDFSIEQIIMSIFNWGKLIIIDNDFVIDDQLYAHLNQEGLTYLSGTPSVITALDLSRFVHLETVTVAGEKFKQTHFNKIRSGFDGRLINAYGVTESTVYNSLSVFGPGHNTFRNTLGNFLSNTSYYLLDSYQRPVPKGAVAELYLAGPCLSPGYLNLEEMNEKHFLPNPDSSKDYPLLYRTGDLVRLKGSGNLEYLRRNDNQVKVRGLRIELQEIECALLKHDSVKECNVLHDEDNLVCIYLLNSEVLEEKLHSFLEQTLPAHMIPILIKYEGLSLPVTINGKLDIKELQNYYRSKRSAPVSTYTPPTGRIEKVLCKIFSSVLGIPEREIGVHDDFFRLGGDSISSLLLAGKIRNQLGARCNVKHIFDFRTIRKLCQNVCSCHDSLRNQDKVNGVIRNEEALRPSGIVPLLPIQQWFFAKDLKNLNHWNQTFAFRVPSMDIRRLEKALQKLLNHHDAFRLRFKSSPDGYIQQYEDVDFDTSKVNFHQLDLAGLDQAQIENQLDRWSSFDIERGPLYSVVYLEDMESNVFKICWKVHHLIVDSVSWRIIKDDLQTLYEGGSLGGKGTSFQEFSLSLKNQFLSEKSYWKTIAEKVPSYNATFVRQAGQKSLNFKFDLDAPLSKHLLCRTEAETGIQDYLLTALGYALTRVTDSSTNFITLEGHGREMGELSNTVGWFTTMYPIEIQTRAEDNIQSNIQRVKQSIRSIPNKGIGYGTIYGYVDPPLPCVSFNFLGSFGSNTQNEWSFCDLSLGLSSGETETKSDQSIMDITAVCDKGRLKFSVDCLLNRETAVEFITAFQNMLEQISKNLQQDVFKNSLPFGDYEAYFEFPSEVNSAPTLFILPPGEGGAECYFNNLLPHLRQFNLVLFNNYYLDRGPCHTTFEELASKYIRYVKAIQAKGPYNLLGWSFGGVLGLEMSRQLTTSGDDHDHIQNIFLIDSYLNVPKAVEDLNLQKKQPIIDPINHSYTPTSTDFEVMCSKTRNIRMFKATLPNDMAKSEEQHLLYEYFRREPFNNLDTLIPSGLITVKQMENQSHVSWAKDCQQVGRISNVIINDILLSSKK